MPFFYTCSGISPQRHFALVVTSFISLAFRAGTKSPLISLWFLFPKKSFDFSGTPVFAKLYPIRTAIQLSRNAYPSTYLDKKRCFAPPLFHEKFKNFLKHPLTHTQWERPFFRVFEENFSKTSAYLDENRCFAPPFPWKRLKNISITYLLAEKIELCAKLFLHYSY